MPKYKYIGKIPYTDLEYNLYNIQPGQVIETKYFLPSNLNDFKLVDTSPQEYLAFSEEYTVADPIELSIGNYNHISIRLKNPNEASVTLHFERPEAPPVLLDSAVPYFDWKTYPLDKLYIMPASGNPTVVVYYYYESMQVF